MAEVEIWSTRVLERLEKSSQRRRHLIWVLKDEQELVRGRN